MDYRAKNGPFKSVDDLEKVTGFGKKTVDKLRADLTVNGAAAPAKAAGKAKPEAMKEAKEEKKETKAEAKETKKEAKAESKETKKEAKAEKHEEKAKPAADAKKGADKK